MTKQHLVLIGKMNTKYRNGGQAMNMATGKNGRGLVGVSVKREISILKLIEWAFQREHAQLDFDERSRLCGQPLPSVGIEYVFMQRGLTGARIDGGGRSWPHDDADLVADAVAHLPEVLGGRMMAVQIAHLARVGSVPDAMIGATPRVVPVEWHINQNGMRGATADAAELGGNGWPAQERRNRKGVIVRDIVRYTPVRIDPTPDQIGRARRNYIRWWAALRDLRESLDQLGLLTAHNLTMDMPPRAPWQKNC